MGVFDNIKSKVTGLVKSRGDKVGGDVDRAGDMLDKRTGGRHADKVDMGQERAKDTLDGLDGKKGDIR